MTIWEPPYDTTEPLIAPKAGYAVTHDDNFIIHRPYGFGDYIIILFHDSMLLRLDDSPEMCCPSSSGLILTPDAPHWYRAQGNSFTHDWIHITGTDAAALFEIPGNYLNYPFKLHNIHQFSHIIETCVHELSTRSKGWQTLITGYCRQLVILLIRELKSVQVSLSPTKADRKHCFDNLRNILKKQPNEPWSIEKMALCLNISTSRFSVLYHEFYGKSPMDEIIDFRIQYSQWLLGSGSCPVSRAAYESGFNDPNYFCRLFRRRTGMTPSQYAGKV